MCRPLTSPACVRSGRNFDRRRAGLKSVELPSVEDISSRWKELNDEAARRGRSIFETSSLMAISAVRAEPDRALWLSSSTRGRGSHWKTLLSGSP